MQPCQLQILVSVILILDFCFFLCSLHSFLHVFPGFCIYLENTVAARPAAELICLETRQGMKMLKNILILCIVHDMFLSVCFCRCEAGPQQSVVPGAWMSGGVQCAGDHRGPARRRGLPHLSHCFLLQLQRPLAGGPHLPWGPAHDATPTVSWKQVSHLVWFQLLIEEVSKRPSTLPKFFLPLNFFTFSHVTITYFNVFTAKTQVIILNLVPSPNILRNNKWCF